MADDQQVLRRVAWRELLPWLMLFRCFGLSITLPVLSLALIGTLLMVGGPHAIRYLSPSTAEMANAFDGQTAQALGVALHPAAGPLNPPSPGSGDGGLLSRLTNVTTGAPGVYWNLAEPVRRLFDRQASLTQFFGNLLAVLWNVAVWAFCGGAITRIAVVQFGRDERLPVGDALRHTVGNYGWYFSAPLFPLLGVAVMMLPLVVTGAIARVDLAAAGAGLIWPVFLLLGLAMCILLLGLLGGWPLMWPTISAEEDSDAFEAFSRSYSYTFQRPLQYLFYAAVALAFSQLCWFLVDHFAEAVIGLTNWGLTFGAGRIRVNEILGMSEESSSLVRTSGALIAWWNSLVRIIAQAVNFALFFSMASVIYLLLRREVDQTDFDDVYLPDDDARYGLPELRSGPAGVPEVESPNQEAAASDA